MKNWEKYEKELKEFGIDDFAVSNGSVCRCVNINCSACDFGRSCYNSVKIRWLYNEADKPKITKRARKFLELVKTGFVARDKTGVAYWYLSRPNRCNGIWSVTEVDNEDLFIPLTALNIDEDLSFITWEDGMWSVENLLMLESRK